MTARSRNFELGDREDFEVVTIVEFMGTNDYNEKRATSDFACCYDYPVARALLLEREETVGMFSILWALIWLVAIAVIVWAVLEHLKCMNRIATALERRAGMEPPAPPNILASR